jgi:TPR repeat protein
MKRLLLSLSAFLTEPGPFSGCGIRGIALRKCIGSYLTILSAFLLMSSVQAAELDSALAERIQTLEVSAEQGQADAQYELGNLYLGVGEVPVDLEKALRWHTLAAEQGNFNAQYNLGVMYMSGQGVDIDYEAAFAWFQLAADQGDLVSQYSLGAMYANGRGVESDLAMAYKWFGIAAASGDRNAQANLVLFQEMLTYDQIVDGQAMAKEWIENYKAKP